MLAATLHPVEESSEGGRGWLDITGSALVTLGLGGIVYALIIGPLESWRSPHVLLALAGGSATMAGLSLLPFVALLFALSRLARALAARVAALATRAD